MSFFTQFFIRPYKHPLVQPPAGSFLMDQQGRVLSSTLPAKFSKEMVEAIATPVLEAFKQARTGRFELNELVVHYSTFKLQASQWRKGTMVYLIPQLPHVPQLEQG